MQKLGCSYIPHEPYTKLFESRAAEKLYHVSSIIRKGPEAVLLAAAPLIQRLRGQKESPDHWYIIPLEVGKFLGAAAITLATGILTIPLIWLLAKGLQCIASYWQNPYVLTRAEFDSSLQFNEESEINVTTYNTIGLQEVVYAFGSKTTGASPRERLPEIAKIIKSSGFDIMCFQEVFDSEATQKMVEELSIDYNVIGHVGDNTWRLSSGLFIASKYPIQAVHFVPFSNGKGVDALAKKGILIAKLDLGNNKIAYIATTHLQANFDESQNMQVREAQLKTAFDEFQDFKSKTKGDSEIVFEEFCGDFNFDDYRELETKDLAELRTSIGRTITRDYFLDIAGLAPSGLTCPEWEFLDPSKPIPERPTEKQVPKHSINWGTALRWKATELTPIALYLDSEGIERYTDGSSLPQAKPNCSRRIDYMCLRLPETESKRFVYVKKQAFIADDKLTSDHCLMRTCIQFYNTKGTTQYCRKIYGDPRKGESYPIFV